MLNVEPSNLFLKTYNIKLDDIITFADQNS